MAKKHNLSRETMNMVAERFKVMSDPMRLQILNTLQGGELSVMEIVKKTEASQPNVSKHLKILQNSGIVGRRREGNLVYYSIADESIFTLCDLVCNSIEARLKSQAEVFSS
ncbi:MAG: winged helix-turn-helix transcriptional regulator [Pyrinomonadaceae bacterium]|nr:winged helix-turn-helix transcriptional regulator [Pyrinomonadaceae bacterium]